jgi:hypothetical protein
MPGWKRPQHHERENAYIPMAGRMLASISGFSGKGRPLSNPRQLLAPLAIEHRAVASFLAVVAQ